MPKQKPIHEQQDTLDKKILISGQGEDPVVQDLVKGKIRKASNKDALDMALALQQIIRGQESILSKVNEQGEEGRKTRQELAELRARMDAMDVAAEKYDADNKKFIQEIMDKAEKLKAVGSDKDKLIAQGAQTYSQEISKARANLVVERQMFDAELERMEQVMVVSAGELQYASVNGQMQAKLFPEEVRIKHRVWTLKPGVPTMVPKVVAQALERKRLTQAETEERQLAMSKNLNGSELEKEQARISQKYGSSQEAVPVSYDR